MFHLNKSRTIGAALKLKIVSSSIGSNIKNETKTKCLQISGILTNNT